MSLFKYDSIHIPDFSGTDDTLVFSGDIVVLEALGLGAPDFMPKTQKAPFQNGESLISGLDGGRLITLNCAITVPTNLTSINTVRRTITQALNPIGMGYNEDDGLTYLGKLSLAQDDINYTYFIDCVPVTSPVFTSKNALDPYQRFSVTFFCPDPYWYGTEVESSLTSVSEIDASIQSYDLAWSPELRLFACCGNGTHSIFTSPDALIWTRQASSLGNGDGICWSPELMLFCATVNDGGMYQFQTSPDGTTWTGVISGLSACSNICWSPELMLFCANSTGANKIQTSPDGITWTARTSALTNAYRTIWSKELYLFVNTGASTATEYIQTSPDGITWTARTHTSGGIVFNGFGQSGLAWSPALGLLCSTYTHTSVQGLITSPDGITWTTRTSSLSTGQWAALIWVPELALFVNINLENSSAKGVQTSPDGINWTGVDTEDGAYRGLCWSPELEIMCTLPYSGATYPKVSYDAINWFIPTSSDYYKIVSNTGDTSTPFELDLKIAGGETGKVISIGNGFLWNGTGLSPNDYSLVIKTDSLKKGTVTVSTEFNNKDITQFGDSIISKWQSGQFFELKPNSNNTIYVKNTGTDSGAPVIRYTLKYRGV